MKTLPIYLSFIAASAVFLCCGCTKNASSAPVPLSAEEVPAVFAQTFANADQETRDQANQYVNDVQNHNVPAAFEALQQLYKNRNLSPDQRATLGRAMTTTSRQLQDAAGTGDERANQVLDSYSSTK